MEETLDLSVVVPMFDEEQVVGLFLARLRPVLDGLADLHGLRYEVVCVDDGSRDRTAELVLAARRDWSRLRLVRLVRNAGHQAALTAGFDAARGGYVVTIDADLQDPPETITDLYELARARNLDVVYAVRSDRRRDSPFKRVTSSLYYRLMRRVAGDQVPSNAGDFRLVSRRVVTAIGRLPEHGRVHRLVIPWFGFPSGEVQFVRESRAAGRSKYPISKMVALAFDSLVAFSAAPLRVATFAGLLGILMGAFALAWSLYGWASGHTVPGWTSILATTGVIGAIQLVCLGLLGEYVARIFTAIHRRPTFIVGYDSAFDEGEVAGEVAGKGSPRVQRRA
ncbi:MAG TPA: glycosyltransferase family 2 protein [Marmoricola sp.]|nr:glycosyltransferase family 2 protein [Marmoricola sp.]